MSRDLCPCGFDRIEDVFTVQWHTDHRAHHLAVFPDVDQCTRDNLAMFIRASGGETTPQPEIPGQLDLFESLTQGIA